MEICDHQSLAIESFSYSWFVNKTTSFGDLDEYLKSSNSSPRNTNFNFDTSISKSSSLNFVHADEIFSNGHIIPKYVEKSKPLSTSIYSLPSTTPVSPFASTTIDHQENGGNSPYFLKKWRKSSKQIMHKIFGVFVRPFCQKVCTRKCIRVDDMNRKVLEVQSQGSSLQSSPRRNKKKIDYRRRLRKAKSWSNMPRELYIPQTPCNSTSITFCDVESSISEAVLYCKRTIGTYVWIIMT